jgi:hypothetical protein
MYDCGCNTAEHSRRAPTVENAIGVGKIYGLLLLSFEN